MIIAVCMILSGLLAACAKHLPNENESDAVKQEIVHTNQDMAAAKPTASPETTEDMIESNEVKEKEELVFPNPRAEQFALSERDAVLFDAAVAARERIANSDICIPEISIYGTYEQSGQTVAICHVCYRFYYGCDGTECYSDSGAIQTPAKAVLKQDANGNLQCISFELVPDGAGAEVWAEDFCGPLIDLREYFLDPSANVEWVLEDTMPSSSELFSEYIESYQRYS